MARSAPKKDKTPSGIAFPEGRYGRRSTSEFGQQVLSEAIGDSDPEAAAAALAEPNWRKKYHRHFVAATEAGIAGPAEARAIASRGLAALHDELRFVRDGEDQALSEVMRSPATGRPFNTKVVPGTAGPTPNYSIPYRGVDLDGSGLRRQLERWVADGVIEVSAATGVEEVLDNPDWLDLSDLTFVVMGAGAEMGPYPALMGLGATVAAIDLPADSVWDRLLSRSAGTSRLLYPIREGRPGADLCADLPELRDWIGSITGQIVIGGYAYADGEAHLRVAAAQDALIDHAMTRHPEGSVTVAHILTPTDCYAVDEDTAEASSLAWSNRPLGLRAGQAVLRKVSGERLFQQAVTGCIDGKDGFRSAAFDTLVTVQGPNYALAKRIQEWRAVDSRSRGLRVSANVGPSSNTASVTKNRALAAGYKGAEMFNIEVFEPDTTNSLMALLLIRDLRTTTGPAAPHVDLTNPLQLLSDAACHGGLWRSPYTTRSALPLAALRGLVKR